MFGKSSVVLVNHAAAAAVFTIGRIFTAAYQDWKRAGAVVAGYNFVIGHSLSERFDKCRGDVNIFLLSNGKWKRTNGYCGFPTHGDDHRSTIQRWTLDRSQMAQ